ncbi:MAG: 30S ribosomal protein S1 [Oscillospiraceae bacterium]
MNFTPELQTESDKFYTLSALDTAFKTGSVLTSRALLFNRAKELIFDLGACTGVMPFAECAIGLGEGTQKDIAAVTRVGHKCQFIITDIKFNQDGVPYCLLSRTRLQTQCHLAYLDQLPLGSVIPCLVTYIESFGAFCDVGCGISALLPIDCMSVSRISSPCDRICVGQNLFCAVKSRDAQNRLVLTMKELLGTWQENASVFETGETVLGIVRSIEEYGVFIELTPNLAGLAEVTEGITVGETVSVYIKSILPQKMKIKLIILSKASPVTSKTRTELFYTQTSGVLGKWTYSPVDCLKTLETIFE